MNVCSEDEFLKRIEGQKTIPDGCVQITKDNYKKLLFQKKLKNEIFVEEFIPRQIIFVKSYHEDVYYKKIINSEDIIYRYAEWICDGMMFLSKEKEVVVINPTYDWI